MCRSAWLRRSMMIGLTDQPADYLRAYDNDLDGALELVVRDVQTAGYGNADAQRFVSDCAADMLANSVGSLAGGEMALQVIDALQDALAVASEHGGVESWTSRHHPVVNPRPYRLKSLAGIGTRKRLDLGVLGAAVLRLATPSDATRFVSAEAAGRLDKFQGWQTAQMLEFEVTSDEIVAAGVDGETVDPTPPLRFQSRPIVLTVRIPAHALACHPRRCTRAGEGRPSSGWPGSSADTERARGGRTRRGRAGCAARRGPPRLVGVELMADSWTSSSDPLRLLQTFQGAPSRPGVRSLPGGYEVPGEGRRHIRARTREGRRWQKCAVRSPRGERKVHLGTSEGRP
jgi:hypothetical protein